MKERILVALQYACLGAGVLLVSLVALARLDGEAGRLAAIEASAAPQSHRTSRSGPRSVSGTMKRALRL